MVYFDVFNGDADGICALQQLRLAEPVESRLVTGVKRDISLLKRVVAGKGDQVTVLDISLDKNRADLQRLLDQGAQVRYYDHHFAGDIPHHDHLWTSIDQTSDQGTCFLVDAALGGRFRGWAVAGTFGDNFDATAQRLAEPLNLDDEQLGLLRELGIVINYNAYGAAEEDLHIRPADLFRRLHPHSDPLGFIAEDAAFEQLREGYAGDMEKAQALQPEYRSDTHALYLLPCEPWARRVSGVFANRLAQGAPECAHAMLTRLPEGGFVVSVRAPLARPSGADDLCRQFATGGGRKAAAGINALPDDMLDAFSAKFTAAFL